MTRLLLRLSLAAAALVSVSSVAMSADLLPPPPPPEELRPATYDWTGMYVGAVGGLTFITTEYVPSCGAACDPDLSGDGFMGGVVGGYNMQFDSFVLGIEGDWMWGGKNAENILDATELSMDGIGTIRARAGWADDDTLIYVTGGYAMADATLTATAFGDDSKFHSGWVVGGGIEHAFWDSLHGRIEYLYASFDNETYDFTSFAGGGTVDLGLDNVHMVRAGLTYNFSW